VPVVMESPNSQLPPPAEPPAAPRLWRRLPTGLAGAAFWLGIWFCLLFFARQIPGGFGTFFSILQIFVGIALAAVAFPLIWRLVRKHMLWSLRNKLVLTYLLIGLAPVVLFVTLVLVVAYIAAGQFAIHLADTRLQGELSQIHVENEHRAERIMQEVERPAPGPPKPLSEIISLTERAIALELPRTVIFEITDTEPAVKNQTASSSYKPAVLSNGARIMVPPYIAAGTRVVILTEDGSYQERAKD